MSKKILIVDDLLFDFVLTRRALQDCAIVDQIAVAEDGVEALKQLRIANYDLILLDIKMPRVSGFELLEQLRAKGNLSAPVFVLFGSNLLADRERADALGAAQYVHKFLDYSEFRLNLKQALARHGFV